MKQIIGFAFVLLLTGCLIGCDDPYGRGVKAGLQEARMRHQLEIIEERTLSLYLDRRMFEAQKNLYLESMQTKKCIM